MFNLLKKGLDLLGNEYCRFL